MIRTINSFLHWAVYVSTFVKKLDTSYSVESRHRIRQSRDIFWTQPNNYDAFFFEEIVNGF